MIKNRGIEKMMLMIKKMAERRTAIVLVIWVLEGLTTVRSLRSMILVCKGRFQK